MSTPYRPGGSRVGLGMRGVYRSAAVFALLLAPFLLLSVLVGSYFAKLVQLLRVSLASAASGPLGAIVSSYPAYLVITAVAFYAVVRLTDSVMSVVTPFMLPSRRTSIEVLVGGEDVDVAFSPPFTDTVLGLATLAFFPLVHDLLFRILLKPVADAITSRAGPLGELATYAASLLVAAVLVRGAFKVEVVARPSARSTASAISMLLLVYLGAVKVSLDRGVGLPSSILMPDVGAVLGMVSESYVNYPHFFVRFLESLLRLLGVAP